MPCAPPSLYTISAFLMISGGGPITVSVAIDYLYYNDRLSSDNGGARAQFTWPNKLTIQPHNEGFVFLQRVWNADGHLNKDQHKWQRTIVTGTTPDSDAPIFTDLEALKTLLSLNIFVLTEVANDDGIPAEEDGGAARIRYRDLETLAEDYDEWKQRKTRDSKKNATGRVALVVGPSDQMVRGIMFIRVRSLSITRGGGGGGSDGSISSAPMHPFHVRDLSLISPDFLLNKDSQVKRYQSCERDYEMAYKRTQDALGHSLPGSDSIALPEYLTNNPRLQPSGSPERVLPNPEKELQRLRERGDEWLSSSPTPLKLPGFAMLMEAIPESSEDYWLTLFGYVFEWIGRDYSDPAQWNALSVGDKVCVITAVVSTPANRGHSYKLDQKRTQQRGDTRPRYTEQIPEVNEQMGGVAVEDCEDDGLEGWKAFYSFRGARFTNPVLVDAQKLANRCVYAILMTTVNGAKVGGDDKTVGAHIVGAVFPLARFREMLGKGDDSGDIGDDTTVDKHLVTVLGEGTGIVPPFNYKGLTDVYDRVTAGTKAVREEGDKGDPTRALNPVLMHQWYKGGSKGANRPDGRVVFGWTQGYDSREQALRRKMIPHEFYNSVIGALFRDEHLGPDPCTALFIRHGKQVGIPMIDLLRPVPLDGEDDVASLKPVIKSIEPDLLRGVATLVPHAYPHPPFDLGQQTETMPLPLVDFINRVNKETRGKPMYERCKDKAIRDGRGNLVSALPLNKDTDVAVVPFWITDWTAENADAMETRVAPALLGNDHVICVEVSKEPLGMDRHAWRLMVLVSMKTTNR